MGEIGEMGEVEVMDKAALRVANAIEVGRTGLEFTDLEAILLGNVSVEVRTILLERACFMRDKFSNLIQQLLSSGPDAANCSKTPVVGIETWVQAKRVATEGQFPCGHSCAQHVAVMNPAIWSKLPEELLQLVFAHLPLPNIIGLGCLSKEWNRKVTSLRSSYEGWDMTSIESEFRRACAETNPKMFALVSEGDPWGSFIIKLYDLKSNRWHIFAMGTEDAPFDTTNASDGGLVCFVSRLKNKEKDPLFIVVCNPLTRDWKVLPENAMNSIQPRMVQLVMEPGTKCYKVLVVGQQQQSHAGGAVEAEVYDSRTGEWSSTNTLSDLVFGYQYDWDGGVGDGEDDDYYENWLDGIRLGPCVYNYPEGQLLDLNSESNPCAGASVKDYVFVKDRLFVLHVMDETTRMHEDLFCISEYQGQKCEPNWVKLRVHRCGDFEVPPWSDQYYMRLYGCKGFLLVTVHNNERNSYAHNFARAYDLSTSKWHAIPAVPTVNSFPESDCTMCELQWDAIP